MYEQDEDGILVAPQEGIVLGPIMGYLEARRDPLWRINQDQEEELTQFPIQWVRVDGSHVIESGYLQSVNWIKYPDGTESIVCAILHQDRQRLITLQKIVYNPAGQDIDWDRLHCPYVIR